MGPSYRVHKNMCSDQNPLHALGRAIRVGRVCSMCGIGELERMPPEAIELVMAFNLWDEFVRTDEPEPPRMGSTMDDHWRRVFGSAEHDRFNSVSQALMTRSEVRYG